MRHYLLVLWLASFVGAFSQVTSNYYNSAESLSGDLLRQSLHIIIGTHRVIPYASSSFDTSDALRVLDHDPANPNNVLLLYARKSEPTNTFGLATGWNREKTRG